MKAGILNLLIIGSGGFTTFSTFGIETAVMIKDGALLSAVANVLVQVVAGLAGATVLRGMEGFGAKSRLHTTKILRLSSDLPIVVEIVDTEEKINTLLPVIDEVIHEGLATVEKVRIRLYRSGKDLSS